MKLTKSKMAAGLFTVLALVGGTAAYAAVGNGGVIHGCYNKKSGAVRVSDPVTNSPKACKASENPLDLTIPQTADVTVWGSLEGGNALGSTRIAPGHYEVTFNRDISTCTPILTVGSFLGGNTANLGVGSADTSLQDPNVVSVWYHEPNAQNYSELISTDFHLAVFC
jgi:hypothetical protein